MRSSMPLSHAGRVERWLGPELLSHIVQASRGVRLPLPVLGMPGEIVAYDGEFHGRMEGGFEADAVQWIMDRQAVWQDDRAHQMTMALADFAAWKAADRQFVPLNKTAPATGNSLQCSLWYSAGTPAAGANAAAAPGGAVPTNATAGSLGNRNAPSGKQLVLGPAKLQAASILTLILYDRLWHVSIGNTAVNVACTGTPNRHVNGAGVQAFAEQQPSGTWGANPAPTDTITYTDQDGNAAEAAPAATLSPVGTNENNAGALQSNGGGGRPWLALAANDSGIRTITNVQRINNNFGAGSHNVVLAKPHAFFPIAAANVPITFNGVTQGVNMFSPAADACLAFLALKTGTGSVKLSGTIELLEAAS